MGLGTATFNGSRVILIINSVVFGTAQSCEWSINYGVKPIQELDRATPRELAPGVYSCSFKISGAKVMSQNFNESGIIAAPGTNYIQPYITLAVLDRITNVPLVYIEAGMIQEFSYSVQTKNIMNFDFSGIGVAALDDQSIIDASNNPPKPVTV